MRPLTGKQKHRLRSLGQTLAVEIAVGKSGPSGVFLEHLRALLERRELVKVRLAEDAFGPARRQAAEDLAAAVQAQCAGVVGRTALLYRPNDSLPPDRRLRLEEE